ncbi:hypothetical protein DM860_004149 [Cuscuta australis]|uniref:Uncharacterized protein n=1 Tax=Cuscuta australis TaxID=267555 RepID=A0A328CV86_9ASTE|nr:hypothetical protein DM860_004149 [Cuscuta australis]
MDLPRLDEQRPPAGSGNHNPRNIGQNDREREVLGSVWLEVGRGRVRSRTTLEPVRRSPSPIADLPLPLDDLPLPQLSSSSSDAGDIRALTMASIVMECHRMTCYLPTNQIKRAKSVAFHGFAMANQAWHGKIGDRGWRRGRSGVADLKVAEGFGFASGMPRKAGCLAKQTRLADSSSLFPRCCQKWLSSRGRARQFFYSPLPMLLAKKFLNPDYLRTIRESRNQKRLGGWLRDRTRRLKGEDRFHF